MYEPRITSSAASRLVLSGSHTPGPGAPVPTPPLHTWASERELVMLRLVADGCSNVEIGARLQVSPETVKSALAGLRRRLGARNRAQLVACAMRQGLLR